MQFNNKAVASNIDFFFYKFQKGNAAWIGNKCGEGFIGSTYGGLWIKILLIPNAGS